MKVLHICTSDSGGAGLCCLRIHQSLLSMGVDSKVMVLKKSSICQEVYQYGRVKDLFYKLPSAILYRLGIGFTEYNEIKYLQEGNKAYTRPVSHIDVTSSCLVDWADIIHLHWINDYVDYPSFFRKVKKPIVWTLHDENFFLGIAHWRKNILPNNKYELKYRSVKTDAISQAKDLSIVFLSHKLFSEFGDSTLLKGRRKYIVNNSVDSNIFYIKDKLSMRRKYNLPIEKNIFVFLANSITDPDKGLNLLSDSLLEIDNNLIILAIGDNPRIETWPNVISVGMVKDRDKLCELICCGDYFAMPSFHEAFAQSPLEAMACGLPVVAFPVSGTDEIINRKNGIICSSFSTTSLSDGIKKLMEKEYDANEIRNYVISKFSPQAISLKYINIYQDIID